MPEAAIPLVRPRLGRLAASLRFLRFRPFETSTAEGRSDERHRRAVLTALAAGLAKCLSIGTALITVPLTLHYLGTEQYGMWMTMSAAVAMLSFADLGIGNGVLNAVARASGVNGTKDVREYVSGGLLVLVVIAAAIIAVFFATSPFVTWPSLFNVHSTGAGRDAAPAMAALVVCFALALPLGVVQRVQMGLQNGFTANLWQCVSSLLGLGFVILAIWLRAGLPWLIIAFAGAPLFGSLLNSIVYFGWLHPDVAPSMRHAPRKQMREVADIGLLFFCLQIAYSVSYVSDNIVIAQILGAGAVTTYSVPQRLFSVVSMLLMMLLTPLWPAYSEAIARGDDPWVAGTLRRSFQYSVAFAAVLSFLIVLSGGVLIRAWVGNTVVVPFGLLLGLGIWQVIQAGGNAAAMFFNGANVVRFQVIVALLTAAVSISLKIVLVRRIGVAGAVWGTTLAYLICSAWPQYRKASAMLAKNDDRGMQRTTHGTVNVSLTTARPPPSERN